MFDGRTGRRGGGCHAPAARPFSGDGPRGNRSPYRRGPGVAPRRHAPVVIEQGAELLDRGSSSTHPQELNANGALAKCRFPRTIPVTQPLVDAYADYQHERSAAGGADVSDFVFVNLYLPPIGEPLRYHNVKKLFDRVTVDLGFKVRPHMLRHSAATRWVARSDWLDSLSSCTPSRSRRTVLSRAACNASGRT